MNKIDGDGKNIRSLLSGTKYSIDYYQREYRWQKKQLTELINDLCSKFLESYEEGHERQEIENYGHYFLGSVIISNRDGRKFIIDGQQRLTTLTLILVYIYRLSENSDDRTQIAELIFSQKFGVRSFNLDVEERRACLDALYNGTAFDEAGASEAVRNMVARYNDIEELFPDELCGGTLPYFTDWLIENVHLVEITAASDEDAYTIFETMNDRGLSLSPADMLKGYLLANINDEKRRFSANAVWKERIKALQELGKDEDADCLKSWLRSQYANSIRERKRGAVSQDFDRLGTEFHRWVRENREALGLYSAANYADIIEKNFSFYSRQYLNLRQAAEKLTAGLESVFYNARLNFTLQYPLLLAPLTLQDNAEVMQRKFRTVSDYIDILIARRIWNFRAIDYSTVQYAMFLVMKDIRGKPLEELSAILKSKLDADTETFSSNERFHLHGTNRRQIHMLLARMTAYLEVQTGLASRFAEYVAPSGRGGYEVEHIWAAHPERHSDEFSHPTDFSEYRNRIGGLLLLPKSFNASYGDLPFADTEEPKQDGKLKHYFGQNLLAKSLHEQCYEHNPGFLRFVDESKLPFKPHKAFKKADLDARQTLYGKLAEHIWNPERLI